MTTTSVPTPQTLAPEATTSAFGTLAMLVRKARETGHASLSSEEKQHALHLLESQRNAYEGFLNKADNIAELDGRIVGSMVLRTIMKAIDFLTLPAFMSMFVLRKEEYSPNDDLSKEVLKTTALNSGAEAVISGVTAHSIVDVAYQRVHMMIGLKNISSEVNPDAKKPTALQRAGMLWQSLVGEELRNGWHEVQKKWSSVFQKDQPPPPPRNRATDEHMRHTAKDLDAAYLAILGKDAYQRTFADANGQHFQHQADRAIVAANEKYNAITGSRDKERS